MVKYHTKSSKRKARFLLVLVLLLALAGASGFWYKNRVRDKLANDLTNPPGTEKIDLSPPTEDDKKAVDQHKEELANQQTQPQTPASGQKQVTPVITNVRYANNQVEVRSFVPGIYESGGSCQATLTKDGQSVVKQTTSVKGATTTDCPIIIFSRSELSAGKWTVVLTYSSATAQGSSAQTTVEVP